MPAVLAALRGVLRMTGVGGILLAILVIMGLNAWWDSLSWAVSFLIDATTNLMVLALVVWSWMLISRYFRGIIATKDAELAALRAAVAAQPKLDGSREAPGIMRFGLGRGPAARG